MDFNTYFDAVKTLLLGINPYQRLLNVPGPYNYPPTSLIFFWPLQFFPEAIGYIVWQILSAAALFLAILVLTKFKVLKSIVFLLLFTVFYFPFKFNQGMGQVNNFIVLLVVLAINSPLALAVAASIKLVPVIFVLPFIIKKKWRYIVKCCVYGLGLLMLSTFIVPIEWQKIYFTDVIFRGFGDAGKAVYYNQSLAGFTFRFFQNQELAKIFFYILAFVTSVISLQKMRKTNLITAFAIASCLYLMINPIAWQHHFVFAVIPVVVIVLQGKIDLLIIVAYLFLAINIKSPSDFTGSLSLILSHQLWGVLILWATLIFSNYRNRVLFGVWLVVIICSYTFYLLSKGGIYL